MRQSLLISAAAAVLLSASVAVAQDRPASAPPGVAPPPSAAPAEKMPETKGTPGAPKGAEQRPSNTQPKGAEQRPSNMQRPTDQTPGAPAQPRAAQPGDAQTPPAARQPSQAQTPQAPSRTPGAAESRQDKSTTSTTSTTITTEQRTRIRETVLRQGNAPRVSNVNFQINVGVVVPRTVRVVPLPVTIVEIQPAWRGYVYFIVDDEIIIVEPNTLRIVAVIPA
jgi:uncharacterized protein DUF1236